MEIRFYDAGQIENDRFKYAVIYASHRGKWIFARHRDRESWEIPGGHREEGEDIGRTAARELFEETGALDYELEPVCDYSVTQNGDASWGRLFHAKVEEIGPLPESEICEIKLLKEMPGNLTYPEIQPMLHDRVLRHLNAGMLEFLERDRARNINMINFMKSYPVGTFDTVGDSAFVRGRSDEDWVYISSGSREEFLELIEGLDDGDKCFAVLEDWMLPYILRGREIRSRLTSMKLVYDGRTPLPQQRYEAVELKASDAPYVYGNSRYKEYISIEYIEDRIKNGVALGIMADGKLASWAITHDDGAIGFLNVLEEYRKKGYGLDVTVSMMKKLLETGELPFVHVEENNTKSMNLAFKAGFRKDRRIHWIKLS